MKGSTKYKAEVGPYPWTSTAFIGIWRRRQTSGLITVTLFHLRPRTSKARAKQDLQAESKLELLKMLRQICRQYNLSERMCKVFSIGGSRAHKKQERAMIRLGIDAMRTQKIKVRGCI